MGDGGLQKVQTYKVSMALLVVYKLVMDFFYIRYISEIWEGKKWCFTNPNFENVIVSWIVYAAILMLAMSILKKPFTEYLFSDFVLLFLLLVSVVPGLSICGAGTFPKKYLGLFYMYWIIMFLLTRLSCFAYGKGAICLPALFDFYKGLAFWSVCAVCTACVLFVFFYYGGGQLYTSSLLSPDVYTTRSEWGNILLSVPIFLRYIIANASVILCFLLLYFLDGRKYVMAGIVCVIQYMNFSCGAKKIDVFMMAICIVIGIMRNSVDTRWIFGLGIGIVGLIIGAFELRQFWGGLGAGNRLFFMPNMLSWCYYDYFQKHLPIICGLFGYETVGKSAISNIIGEEYMEMPGMYANNGLFGDTVMMFGVYGVIIGPILWSLYLHVLDKVSQEVSFTIKMGMGLFLALIMQNSSMTTCMLSHGGAMLIILLVCCGGIRQDRDISCG